MNKIKLLTLLVLVIFFLASCTKETYFAPEENIKEPDFIPTTRIVSESQAKSFVEQAANALIWHDTPLTRGNTTRGEVPEFIIEEIHTLMGNNGMPALYAVNFTDNNGFMILSADKEAPNPMFAFSDTGNFSPSSLQEDSPSSMILNEKIEQVSTELATAQIDINKLQTYEMWEYLYNEETGEIQEMQIITEISLVSYESVADEVRFTCIEERERQMSEMYSETRARHKWQRGFRYVSPMYAYYLNWGQDSGYNADAPRPNVDLAGCPAVSIGQLCYTHMYPSKYEYWSMPFTLASSVRTSNPISRMLRDIADNITPYYWGSVSSGADGVPIQNGLRKLGYSSAVYTNYDFLKAYWNMYDGYPVLLGGQSNTGGHVWYCNGYDEWVWKVTKTTKFLGIKVKTETWYEYADYIYMNFGWKGDNNGWYDQEDWGGYYNKNRMMWYNLYPR